MKRSRIRQEVYPRVLPYASSQSSRETGNAQIDYFFAYSVHAHDGIIPLERMVSIAGRPLQSDEVVPGGAKRRLNTLSAGSLALGPMHGSGHEVFAYPTAASLAARIGVFVSNHHLIGVYVHAPSVLGSHEALFRAVADASNRVEQGLGE